MNYVWVEVGVALSRNKQCHSREGGNLVREMRCLIEEVPAFLRMDALMSREHMDVRSDRGNDIASRTVSPLASNTATAAPLPIVM